MIETICHKNYFIKNVYHIFPILPQPPLFLTPPLTGNVPPIQPLSPHGCEVPGIYDHRLPVQVPAGHVQVTELCNMLR